MKKKVILISIDGMRPDGFLACGNPYCKEMMAQGSYTLSARTVFPSVTLPCHMSMFHSVTPERHGITTNLYMLPVRPIDGLFERVHQSGGSCAMYYGLGPIRDVARPESLTHAEYIHAMTYDRTDDHLTQSAIRFISKRKPYFVFLYMVETDEKGGHDIGWMTPAYLDIISAAIENVRRVREAFGDEYDVLVTADHGGHDRSHGTDMPEDMTIPMFFFGSDFTPGKELSDVSILDLAPTIADLMGVIPAPQWEGKSLVKES